MQVPLEIGFHNIDSSTWAENEIRDRVAQLESRFGRINSCRVRVDQRAKAGVPPVVRIEIGLPGRADIVVSHEPDHLQQKFQDPDLKTAIVEAFRIAERQLVNHKEQLQGRTKAQHHDAANQFLGQVAELHAERDHGFLLTKEGGLLYFHRNSVLQGSFDNLKRGVEVLYVEDVGDTGPIATKVRIREG